MQPFDGLRANGLRVVAGDESWVNNRLGIGRRSVRGDRELVERSNHISAMLNPYYWIFSWPSSKSRPNHPYQRFLLGAAPALGLPLETQGLDARGAFLLQASSTGRRVAV
jgi:hypothetical protein